jgi:hypothetical protein
MGFQTTTDAAQAAPAGTTTHATQAANAVTTTTTDAGEKPMKPRSIRSYGSSPLFDKDFTMALRLLHITSFSALIINRVLN